MIFNGGASTLETIDGGAWALKQPNQPPNLSTRDSSPNTTNTRLPARSVSLPEEDYNQEDHQDDDELAFDPSRPCLRDRLQMVKMKILRGPSSADPMCDEPKLVDVYCGFQPLAIMPQIARIERLLYGDAIAVHVHVVIDWPAGPLSYDMDVVDGFRKVQFQISMVDRRKLSVCSGGPDEERFISVGKLSTDKVDKEEFRKFAQQYLDDHSSYKVFSENCRKYSDVLMLKAVTDQAIWGCKPVESPLAFIHEKTKLLNWWIKRKVVTRSATLGDLGSL